MAYKINKDNSIKHECKVLSYLLNPVKDAKNKNSHYSQILQGCMNTCSGREKFSNFRILMESESSSTIVMVNLKSKLKQKQYESNMWKTQSGNFTTSNKVNVYFFQPGFIVTKFIQWKCHVNNSTSCTYKVVLGRDLLTALVIDIKFLKKFLSAVKDHTNGDWHICI